MLRIICRIIGSERIETLHIRNLWSGSPNFQNITSSNGKIPFGVLSASGWPLVLIGIISPLASYPIHAILYHHDFSITTDHYHALPSGLMISLTRYSSALACHFCQPLPTHFYGRPVSIALNWSGLLRTPLLCSVVHHLCSARLRSVLFCSVLPFLTYVIACYLLALTRFSWFSASRWGRVWESWKMRTDSPLRHGPSSAIKGECSATREILHRNCLAC